MRAMTLPSMVTGHLRAKCFKPTSGLALARKHTCLAFSSLRCPDLIHQQEITSTSAKSISQRDVASTSGSASPPPPIAIGEDSPHHGSVRAGLKYQQGVGERLYTYLYPPPRGMPYTNAALESRHVDIANARHVASTLDVDRNGFQIAAFRTSLAYDDFRDDTKIKEMYYSEVSEVVKRATGASIVLPFDYTLRKRPENLDGKITAMDKQFLAQQPVDRVHVDYTETSGPERARILAGKDADTLLQRRFAIIQVWRPLKGPVIDAPVAFCDATTAKNDLVPMDLMYRDRTGQIYMVTFGPGHKWYYVPRMEASECVVFKCYDSDQGKAARFTPHTGFFDPTTPTGADPRESIDVRTLAFW